MTPSDLYSLPLYLCKTIAQILKILVESGKYPSKLKLSKIIPFSYQTTNQIQIITNPFRSYQCLTESLKN